MKIPSISIFLLAGAALASGQTPAPAPGVCAKNVSFAVAEGGQPVPAIPKFASKWVDKKLPKSDYGGLCFSQIPSSTANNYVVVFSTTETMFEGLIPTAHTYTSAPADGGNTTKASSYGGTWSYAYAGVPPPKTTSTLDLRLDDKPKSLFARAYNQQGHVVSKYSLAGFPSREKLLEYVLAAIAGDVVLPSRLLPKAAPLSVYYVNCDVDSPAVQTSMAPTSGTSTATVEPPHKEAPPPMPLEIWSNPPGADIAVDGMPLGKTPHSLVVPPGEHVVTLRKQDFGTWERRVVVDNNQRRVTAYLERRTIALNFPVDPNATAIPPAPAPAHSSTSTRAPKEQPVKDEPASDAVLDFWSAPAGASIFVDGSYVGETPYSLVIAPGPHTVSLRKKDSGTWERKIVVAAGERKVGATLVAQRVSSTTLR